MIKLIQRYIRGTSAVNIAEAIEEAVRQGALNTGDPLPPIRTLAKAVDVSPGTAAAAYKRLANRGVVVSRGRRGTHIAQTPAPEFLAPIVQQGLTDLAIGNPDPRLLPPFGPALSTLEATPILYGDPLVDPTLKALMEAHFGREGVHLPGLAVVGGAMDGLERILREELALGDAVAVEDPGFTGILNLLRALGLRPVPVAIDPFGMVPQALEDALTQGVSAVITVPRAQNPTGAAFDDDRAAALAEVLGRFPDPLYLEDDHAGAVAGVTFHTATRQGRGRQAVIRSFSKALGPDCRLAVVRGNGPIIDRIQRRQAVGMRWVSHILQRMVASMWADPDTQSALERAQKAYSRRRQALLSALREEGIGATGRSGLNVWIPVPDEARALQGLWAAGYAVSAGSPYRLSTPPAIRVTISELMAPDAVAFARVLKAVLRPQRRSTGA